jgi:hypothetical protein
MEEEKERKDKRLIELGKNGEKINRIVFKEKRLASDVSVRGRVHMLVLPENLNSTLIFSGIQ